MKYLITESQYRLLNEEPEEIMEIPFKAFSNDWNFLQEYLEMIGNPPYKIIGNLNLFNSKIESLGDLQSVEGNLDLAYSKIESLGNLQYVGGYLDLHDSEIQSLGNLQSVEGNLDLAYSKIESLGNLQYVGGYLDFRYSEIQSLGNLQSVEGDLYLDRTPLSKTTTEEEIRNKVKVGGNIYL